MRARTNQAAFDECLEFVKGKMEQILYFCGVNFDVIGGQVFCRGVNVKEFVGSGLFVVCHDNVPQGTVVPISSCISLYAHASGVLPS